MSWEQRGGGGRYYTRSRREDGRILREYVGSGPLAELMALADENDRRRREEEARAWREEREDLERLDGGAGELCELAELLNRAALLYAGYRQHNRGECRIRGVRAWTLSGGLPPPVFQIERLPREGHGIYGVRMRCANPPVLLDEPVGVRMSA